MEYANDISHDFIIFETERLSIERESMKLFNECILYFESIDNEITLYGESVLSKIKDGVVNIAKKIWKFIINFIKGAVRLITKPFGIRFKWSMKDGDNSTKDSSSNPSGGGGSSSPSANKAKNNNDTADVNIFNKDFINPKSNGFLSFNNVKVTNVFPLYRQYMNTIKKEANKSLNQSDNISFTKDEINKMTKQFDSDKKKLNKIRKILENALAFKPEDIKNDDDIVSIANKNIKANLEVDKLLSSNKFKSLEKYVSVDDLNQYLKKQDLIAIELNDSSGSIKNSKFKHGYDLLSIFFENIITYINSIDGKDDIIAYSDYINKRFKYIKSSDSKNLNTLNAILTDSSNDKIKYNSVGYDTHFLKNMLKLEEGNFNTINVNGQDKSIDTVRKVIGVKYNVTRYGKDKPMDELPNRYIRSYENIKKNKTLRSDIEKDILNPAINKLNKIEGGNGNESVEKNVKENNDFSSVKDNLTTDLNMLKNLLNGVMKATNDIIKFLTLIETSERSSILYVQLLAFDFYMKRMLSLYIQISGLQNIDDYPKLKGLQKNLKSILSL